jgi:3-dehydro-L-gulonate 2-dehydrogenase
LESVLRKYAVPEDTAKLVAATMTENSLDGIYTHGVNRFSWLVKTIREGIVDVKGKAERVAGFGALERYDGNAGIGIPNAIFCMDRAIELARQYGIGCAAIRNTNHWMRAATYGYRACNAGMAAICFTNTMPNMPTWGALDSRLGNNPMTFAFPRAKGNLVCDMAMSQFSYGAMELAVLNGKQMPIDAGFDSQGNLTRDPKEVLKTGRILPTGDWKGAALSHLLDIFAAGLSLGNTTAKAAEFANGTDQKVSQVFIAVNYRAIAPNDRVEELVEHSVEYLLHSKTEGPPIIYTGQITDDTRRDNTDNGIPVNETVWKGILAL